MPTESTSNGSPAKPSQTSAWTQFEKVTDYPAIVGYGVMSNPGLGVDEKVVLSGRLPTAAKVRASFWSH